MPETTIPAYFAPNTAVSSPWQGTPTYAEFEYDQGLGQMLLSVLSIPLNFSGTSGNASTIVPAQYLIDHIEYKIGDVIETVYANDLFHESVSYQTSNDFNNMAANMNMSWNSSNGYTYSGTTYYSANNGLTLYIPLTASFFNTAQLHPNCLDDKLKVKVYFTGTNAAIGGTTSNVVSLASQPLLWVFSAKTTDAQLKRDYAQHTSGILYRSLVRTRQTFPYTSPTSTAGQQFNLTSLANDSAGLLIYSTPVANASNVPASGTASSSGVLLRCPLSAVGLQDKGSTNIIPPLPSALVQSWINPQTLAISKEAQVQPFYVLSFCSDLARTLADGSNTGGLKLTGNEKIIITDGGSLASVLTVCSYDSAVLYIKDRRGRVEIKAA